MRVSGKVFYCIEKNTKVNIDDYIIRNVRDNNDKINEYG